MPKKKTTEELVENLARAVKLGFDQTATKEGLHELQRHADAKFRVITDAVERLERDSVEAQAILRPLARMVPEHEDRITRVEKKVGSAR